MVESKERPTFDFYDKNDFLVWTVSSVKLNSFVFTGKTQSNPRNAGWELAVLLSFWIAFILPRGSDGLKYIAWVITLGLQPLVSNLAREKYTGPEGLCKDDDKQWKSRTAAVRGHQELNS